MFLDGAYHEDSDHLVGNELGDWPTREIGEVLELAVRRARPPVFALGRARGC
ncbi:hypothetical protein WMF31_40675 [Sorangium sp. So ce1036]|uniref:hypothetical protein n=1 Tax=Sorangium sp. So ce1036 TaxID=3133328 RepID=UPI003F118ED2